MASRAGNKQPPTGRLIVVDDRKGARPFMRGIMVHSLMSRGVPFDEAYSTADAVRDRLKGRASVPRGELEELVQDALGRALPAERPKVTANITVTRGDDASPFSKGTLSQSLLAASLEPDDAFAAARDIELTLLRRGAFEVTRKELRELTAETLESRFGERTAERYRVWREYQEPDRPVLVLIGGTTGAGKTSLALEVARRLGIHRVLSTDSIRHIMRLMLSADLMPALHRSSFDAHCDLPPAVGGEDPVLEGFTAQSTAVSVGVRAILDRAVAENTSLVLDGVTLVPGLIDLDAYADVAHVIFVVVATLDADAFERRFAVRGNRESRRGVHRYVENLEAILRIQDHFLELADRFDVPIVDNDSIDESVIFILRYVVETLRKKGKPGTSEAV